MPKYRFEFLESQNTEWVTDIDLSDDSAAIEEARRTAIEMFHDATLEKRLPLRWIAQYLSYGRRHVGQINSLWRFVYRRIVPNGLSS